MKAVAIAGFMVGLIFLWIALISEPTLEKGELRSEGPAFSFVAYRNAVNAYALDHKTPGVISTTSLSLPYGLGSVSRWQNQVINEGGGLHCYVYGPATTYEFLTVLSFLHNSPAIGRSNHGMLERAGSATPYPLPAFITHGDIVSVISVK